MGRFATGVTVVTSHHRGQDAGMTVNAFLSVSLDPPTVLVSLNQEANTTPIVDASGRFAVCLLSARQRHLSELFAARIPLSERFQAVSFHRGRLGLPILDGGLGALECEVVERIPYRTHHLYLGKVVGVEVGEGELPLVFWRGGYATPSHGDTLVMSPPRPSSTPSRPASPRRPRRSRP